MKTDKEIRRVIRLLKKDPRWELPRANPHLNAPLAFVQADIDSQIMRLQWVLGEYDI